MNIFNFCEFSPGYCVEKLSLPPRNKSRYDGYLTFEECSEMCKNLDSQVLTKTHLTSMSLVQKWVLGPKLTMDVPGHGRSWSPGPGVKAFCCKNFEPLKAYERR